MILPSADKHVATSLFPPGTGGDSPNTGNPFFSSLSSIKSFLGCSLKVPGKLMKLLLTYGTTRKQVYKRLWAVCKVGSESDFL